MSNKIKTILKSVFALVLFVLSFQAMAVWQAPTTPPPPDSSSVNTEPPINVGTILQYKAGSVVADGLRAALSLITDASSISTFNGSIKITSGIPGAGKVLTSSDAFGLASWQALPAVTNYWSLGTNGTDIYNNNNSNKGNVGIGTTSPNGLLTLKNTNPSTSLLAIQNYANTGLIGDIQFNQTYDTWKFKNYANGAITFGVDTGGTATERLRISSSGNVGIGTTAPGAKLEVAGQVKITSGTGINAPGTGKVLTSDAFGLASWAAPIAGVWTTNANDIYNANTGKVGIGTGATAPASKLFVAGGSYNINSGANNANYALGAQSIAANDSIYSYGLICAGNNNGDCTGTGAGKWGVVISGSGIIFPDGTKQTTATAVDSTKVLKTGDSMTGPLTIGYSGSNGGSLNLTYGYQTTSGNINSSINVTGGPGVYTGGANGPITSAITATGGVISGGAGTSYALRAIAGSGGTG